MATRPVEDSLLHLPVGTRYHLPDTGDRLPYVHNPHAARLVPRTREEVRPTYDRLFGPELAQRILTDEGIPDWATYVYSFADEQRIRLLILASLAALAWDDPMTRTALASDTEAIGARTSRFASAINGHRPADDLSSELLLWQVHHDLRTLCGPAFTRRFRDRCLDINATMVEESRHRIHRELPDWDEYIAFRRVNLFGFWLTTMAEFSVGVDMTRLLTAHPDLRAAELAAVDHILFTNDLHSFPKEARIGEVANTMWLLRRSGLPLQDAVNHLAHLVVSKQDEFLHHSDAVLDSPLGTRPDVRAYLEALAHALGGNLHYHRTTPRYHGPHHDGAIVNNGTVVIGEHTNTFTPAT